MHCSVLAEEAIRAAIKDYYDKHGIAYDKKQFPDPSDEEEHPASEE
jgi:nitrogen fixation NifU-like protein